MKYELEKEEFIAIHTTLQEMFTKTLALIESLAHNSHDLSLRRLKLEQRRQEFAEAQAGLKRIEREEFDHSSEEEEEVSEEPQLKEVSALQFPQEKEVPPPPTKSTTYIDEQLTDDEVDSLYTFLSVWLENFNEEGPQPDRADLIRQYSLSKKIHHVLKGMELYGGITQTIQVYLKGTDHPKKDDKDFPFFVASNICSVTSLVYPPLAEKFEYVNPLT